MNRVDVFFTDRQGRGEGRPGRAARRAARPARHPAAPGGDRARSRARPRRAERGRYAGAVADWQDRRAALYERMIADELGADGVRRLPGLGRPGPLRRDPADPRPDPRARRRRLRGRVDPGDQQRAGARRRAPDRAEPDRAAVHRHDRAPARRRGPAAGRRRRRRDAGRASTRSPRCPTTTWTSTGVPTSAPPDEVLVHGTCSRSRTRSMRRWAEQPGAQGLDHGHLPAAQAAPGDAQRARPRRHRGGAPARRRAARATRLTP